MPGFLRELDRRDPLLTRLAGLHVALALVLVVAMGLDDGIVLGADRWLKPFKFAVSIAIYLFTMAWLLGYARRAVPRTAALVGWGVALAMVAEMVCISLQAGRGVPSHFNDSSAFDGAVFGVMGLMIAWNTALLVLVLGIFLRHRLGLASAELLGIRAGLVVALLASGVGGLMVSRHAHSVGGADGGPGLPVVGWSVEHGDLRAAHALGLHALQVLPFLGWWMAQRPGPRDERARTMGVLGLTVLYTAAFAGLLLLGLSGRPLIGR